MAIALASLNCKWAAFKWCVTDCQRSIFQTHNRKHVPPVQSAIIIFAICSRIPPAVRIPGRIALKHLNKSIPTTARNNNGQKKQPNEQKRTLSNRSQNSCESAKQIIRLGAKDVQSSYLPRRGLPVGFSCAKRDNIIRKLIFQLRARRPGLGLICSRRRLAAGLSLAKG